MTAESGSQHMGPSNKVHPNVPFQERPTCTVAEACEAVGLGKTKMYELMGDGVIESILVGRRRLIRISSLLQLLDGPMPGK